LRIENFLKKTIVFLVISISLVAKQCADQYSDEAFLDAPERLGGIIDEGLKSPLFQHIIISLN